MSDISVLKWEPCGIAVCWFDPCEECVRNTAVNSHTDYIHFSKRKGKKVHEAIAQVAN